VYPFEECELL